MKSYLVGGAVRDALIGLPNHDKDYVVVGARPEDLLSQGFVQVGRDFPVFLHPQTHDEYALARTERKSGKGYTGFTVLFDPSVTLEEDLRRRDLTINSMAQDNNGNLIDPFNGKYDLHHKILRHTSQAFVEDPVRILRLARFAARFVDFSVADETMDLMQQMVNNAEVNALVPERVWQEIARGLMEQKPSRMFEILRQCGALDVLLPEVSALFTIPERLDYHPEGNSGTHTMLVIDRAAALGYTLPERFAALTHDLGKAFSDPNTLPKHHGHEARGMEPLSAIIRRLNVPNDCARLAKLVVAQHGKIHKINELKPSSIIDTLHCCDAFRQKERFLSALKVCRADAQGRLNFEESAYPQEALWCQYLQAASQIDKAHIAAQCIDSKQIPLRIREAEINAIKMLRRTH